MTMHAVDFEYNEPGVGSIEMDLDPSLDKNELEEIALLEVREVHPDLVEVGITTIREI